jgi:SAM-dependent methyltransferase
LGLEQDQAVLHRIRGLRQLRRPFARLEQRIVHDVLGRFLPSPANKFLEIGAGDGQLADWLPAGVAERVVFTEPLDIAIREFRACHPGREVTQASAGSLPFADATFDAVLGLCVLDVVDDLDATARELSRVLRPGGRLIHLLDMSTVLSGAFEMLSRSDFIPLPNVVAGPAGQRWPEDLLLVPASQLRKIVEVLRQHGYPFAGALPEYLAAFSSRPFPLQRALSAYTEIAESRDQRAALKQLLAAAPTLADPATRALFQGFRAQPVSSARFFETRLKTMFGAPAGFELAFSDVVTSSEVVPNVELAPLRYLALCVGRRHESTNVPAAVLKTDAQAPGESETLLELGIHVFVARRIG